MDNSNIFISPMTVNEKGKKKLKTKSEMDEDEYKKVCDRMKQLRDSRKEKINSFCWDEKAGESCGERMRGRVWRVLRF